MTEADHTTSLLAALLVAPATPCAGSTTPEVEQCLSANFSAADPEMNRYYAAALARLGSYRFAAVIAKLRASQREWITYRDRERDAIHENWKEGTVRGAMMLSCKTRGHKGPHQNNLASLAHLH